MLAFFLIFIIVCGVSVPVQGAEKTQGTTVSSNEAYVSKNAEEITAEGNTDSVSGNDSRNPDGIRESVSQEPIPDLTSEPEAEILNVIVPSKVQLLLNPYRIGGEEQITSEDIVITNQSGFAIESVLELVSYEVKKTEDNQEAKDCEIILYRRDSDFEYRPLEGTQKNIDTVSVPDQSSLQYYFKGSVKEGSEAMWENDDISLRIVFRFYKAAIEE